MLPDTLTARNFPKSYQSPSSCSEFSQSMHNLLHHHLRSLKRLGIIICDLDQTRRDDNLSSPINLTPCIATHGPNPTETRRLCENHNPGVCSTLHDGDKVLEASCVVVGAGRPGGEGGAECACRGCDSGVAGGYVVGVGGWGWAEI